MKCIIEYVGKSRSGKTKYYCTTHKSYAHDKDGLKLDECLWLNKDIFDNSLDIKNTNINSIIIKYDNILKSSIPKIMINNQEFYGILTYDESKLTYKDFTGILLAKLNNTPLATVKCNHCAKYHSDNGMFAYTPHLIHLCLYCGHLFRAKEKNVGSELNMIYDIPNITLDNKTINITDTCSLEYDVLKGNLLINKENARNVLYNNDKLTITEFLNQIFKDEY